LVGSGGGSVWAKRLLVRNGIPMDDWAHAEATVSIDGWGHPYRIYQQMLLGTAILKQASWLVFLF
jgi:hypothetical protein